MHRRHNHHIINRYSLSVLAIIIVAAATYGSLALWHADAVTPPIGAAVSSQFSFHGAADWRQGATNRTSIALFHEQHDGCFVSLQHRSGTLADGRAKERRANASLALQGYTVIPRGTRAVTINMPDGSHHYNLDITSVTTPAGAHTVMGGQAVGFVQLADGYLYIEGYCNTADQLPAAIPALRAVTFDPTK